MKLKIYLYTLGAFVRDGAVSPDDVLVSTFPARDGDVPLGSITVDVEIPAPGIVLQSQIESSERELENYRVVCFEKLSQMQAKINELKAITHEPA